MREGRPRSKPGTAFIVEQRVHELSVRRALEDSQADLMTMLLRDNLRPVIAGVACGLFVVLTGARLVQNLLSGISARHPLAVVAAVVVLMVAAPAAVLLPARRAARLAARRRAQMRDPRIRDRD